VLEGRAVVQVDDERVELEIGDSVSFMARRPHSFGGLDGEPARLIVSMTPPAF
jgi:mannose-6-phosphate isomerase-like protein (cupin superfamily)